MKESVEAETLRGATHPEASSESFRYSRALDDNHSPIPATKDTLGGKGWGLVEMTKLDLPVPPGFIVTTGAWCEFHSAGDILPENIWGEILKQRFPFR